VGDKNFRLLAAVCKLAGNFDGKSLKDFNHHRFIVLTLTAGALLVHARKS
jgi:hypothetical protein